MCGCIETSVSQSEPLETLLSSWALIGNGLKLPIAPTPSNPNIAHTCTCYSPEIMECLCAESSNLITSKC